MAEERRTVAATVRLSQAQMERLADMLAERVVRRLREEGYGEEKYLTYAEAAEYLGYKLNTLRKMVCQGEVPCDRGNGGAPRFTKAALTKWMRRRNGSAMAQ